MLTDLESTGWIDYRTRAVIVEVPASSITIIDFARSRSCEALATTVE